MAYVIAVGDAFEGLSLVGPFDDDFPVDDYINDPCHRGYYQHHAYTVVVLTPAVYTLAVYLVDRAYGGPEEGGWWYSTGTPEEPGTMLGDYQVPERQTFRDASDAHAAVTALQDALDAGPNVGRRDIGSVLSTGQYAATIIEGTDCRPYPAVRPRYE